MLKYILKRVLISVPVIIGVIFITFILLNVVPGDPITVMMKEKVNPDVIENLRSQMHLDDPVMVRFFVYIADAIRGDFGVSYKLNRSVTAMITDAFPNTLKLALISALVSWLMGIPIGMISAVKRGSFIDGFFMASALLGVSMPIFWTGLLLQYVFAYKLNIMPVAGFTTPVHLIMPSFVLGWQAAGSIARLTRSSLLEVLKDDYIRTARAKGLKERSVLIGHALKNALLPVVTMMAIQVASLLSGAVITETIFNIPGIGRLSVNAIQTRDMPLLQGTVVFTTILIILGNLTADILYSFIDPRIRYE